MHSDFRNVFICKGLLCQGHKLIQHLGKLFILILYNKRNKILSIFAIHRSEFPGSLSIYGKTALRILIHFMKGMERYFSAYCTKPTNVDYLRRWSRMKRSYQTGMLLTEISRILKSIVSALEIITRHTLS